MPTLKQIEEQFQSIADIALDYDGYQRTVDLMKLIDELRYMALEGVLMVQEGRKERKKMKQDASNTKDAFNCKHLLPCGMCEKTDKLCTQTEPKRYFVSVTFICKKCGNHHEVLFSPTQRHLDLFVASLICDKCGGEFEEIGRSFVEKGGYKQ